MGMEEAMTEEIKNKEDKVDKIKEGEKMQEETKQTEEKVKEYVERKRWVFLGLPFTFTKYTINDEVITIDTGLLNTVENDCYLYKVQDVELKTSLMERIFGLGTVACYTGDNTHPQLYLEHIKHAKEIKNFILSTSEEARRKRRTLNTLNIDADDLDEI
ncbi:MAG: PH domain-containing protein [Lachnospiraceae bacterium]